jgi:hypothetical protein
MSSTSRGSLVSSSTSVGQHFSTSRKKRDKRKTQTVAHIPGHSTKRAQLLSELTALLEHPSQTATPQSILTLPTPDGNIEPDMMFTSESTDEMARDIHDASPQSPGAPRHRDLTESSSRLMKRWQNVIPTMIEPYVKYLTQTLGKPLVTLNTILSGCSREPCERKRALIVCLYFDRTSPFLPSVLFVTLDLV